MFQSPCARFGKWWLSLYRLQPQLGKIKITRAIVHPHCGKPELNFEGKPHAVAAYEVGLLHTDENARSWRNSIPANVSVT
jgi:hypothetical protein